MRSPFKFGIEETGSSNTHEYRFISASISEIPPPKRSRRIIGKYIIGFFSMSDNYLLLVLRNSRILGNSRAAASGR